MTKSAEKITKFSKFPVLEFILALKKFFGLFQFFGGPLYITSPGVCKNHISEHSFIALINQLRNLILDQCENVQIKCALNLEDILRSVCNQGNLIYKSQIKNPVELIISIQRLKDLILFSVFSV